MFFIKTIRKYFQQMWQPMGQGQQFPINNSRYGGYDAWQSMPEPSVMDLLQSYEDVVAACVGIISNNIADALKHPKICVTTTADEPRPKAKTKKLSNQYKQFLDKNFKPYVRTAERVEEVIDHASVDLFDRPNSQQSFQEVIALTAHYLELVGSAFWKKEWNDQGRLAQIWVLPVQNIIIDRDEETGLVRGYWNGVKDDDHYLKPREVIHFKYINPTNPYAALGKPPVRTVWQRVQLMRKESSSWESILTNACYPSALVGPPDGVDYWSSDYAERLQKQLEERFSKGRAGGPFVQTEPYKYQAIATPPKDLSALQLYDQIKSAVCNAYAVPRSMLDLQDSNFASADVAHRSFQLYCIKPRLALIVETINRHLVSEFSDRLFIVANEDLQVDKAYELQKTQTYVNLGIWTINDVLTKEGDEPKSYGDKPQWLQTMAQSPSAPAFNLNLTGLEAKSKEEQEITPDKGPVAGQRLLARELQRIYEDMAAFALDHAKDQLGAAKLAKLQAKAFIPEGDWTDELKERLTPILRIMFQRASKDFVSQIGGDVDIPLLPIDKLNDAVDRLVLALADSTLSITTQDVDKAISDTRDALRRGLDSGEAHNQLTARISAIFDDLSTSRSYLIADTESNRIKHDAELQTAKESGINMKKVWLPDALACDKCKKLAGVAKNLDEPFAVTGPGPYGRIDAPPFHPQCRCTLTYELEE